jgi:enamine deaminase RidA (YjgF/YER057c/UK114 family)
VGKDDPVAQIEQAFSNLERVLTATNLTFADVVKLGFYVTSIDLLPAIREVRDRYVNTEQPPASTLVAGVGLFRPEFVFEVDALAIRAPRE